MPVAYEYNRQENMVRTRPTGLLTVPDIADYFYRVAEDPAVERGFTEIVYFDDVGDFAFTYSQAHLIIRAYNELMRRKGCAGTVFVASVPLGYGIARMLAAINDQPNEWLVVRSEEELAELLAKKGAAPDAGGP